MTSVIHDYSLIEFYAGLHPSDPRLKSANLAEGDGKLVLEMAKALLDDGEEADELREEIDEAESELADAERNAKEQTARADKLESELAELKAKNK